MRGVRRKDSFPLREPRMFQEQEEQEGTRGGPRGRGAARRQSSPGVCSAGFMLTQEAFNYLGCETEQLIISRLQRFIDLPETFSTVWPKMENAETLITKWWRLDESWSGSVSR